MAKECEEEFNPWPPFVDVFASVILVLMLFLLITVVNIGYYAQFKSKKSFIGSTETPKDVEAEVSSIIKTKCSEGDSSKNKKQVFEAIKAISFHKIDTIVLEKDANNSFFKGGENEGNAMSYALNQEPKKFLNQSTNYLPPRLYVNFEDKEIFINAKIKFQVRKFVKEHLRKNRGMKFVLEVIDPSMIISRTIARQISLGRVLNLKSVIIHSRVPKAHLKLNLMKKQTNQLKFGQVIITAINPNHPAVENTPIQTVEPKKTINTSRRPGQKLREGAK